jgi:hypothetical protein
MQKTVIFFYGNHNLNARFTAKMVKSTQLCHIHFRLNRLAWTLPEPHISTSENLHAKQTPVFSASLRPKTAVFRIFGEGSKLWRFSAKVLGAEILAVGGRLGDLFLCSSVSCLRILGCDFFSSDLDGIVLWLIFAE